jgi:photosystem II stability/assembly factor-like uncharacterized protein
LPFELGHLFQMLRSVKTEGKLFPDFRRGYLTMNRMIYAIGLVTILLTSCNFPGLGSSPQSEEELPTPGTDVVVGKDRVPTLTPEPTLTSTATETPLPSPIAAVFPELPTPTQRDFPTPQPLTAGEPVTLTKIKMFDTRTGWGTGFQQVSGARVLYTEDGGITWSDRTPPEQIAEMVEENESVWSHFLDASTAWVIYAPQRQPPPVDAPVVWRTTDGGLTWDPSPPLQADGMEDFFSPEGFASVGNDYGWLLVHVGAGMSHDYSYLYATTDGGATWERVADPYGIGIQSLHNTGLAFADPKFGWVSKNNLGVMPGAFYERTTDGGTTWEKVFLPAPTEHDWFNEVSLCETSSPIFTSDQTGVLIVNCRLPEDIQNNTLWSLTYIYTTSDRGETWEHVRLPSPVEKMIYLDQDLSWAFGRDHYRTTDNWHTWELVKTVNWDGDFSYVDPLNAWAIARNEGAIALVVTEDGGGSWQIIEAVVR